MTTNLMTQQLPLCKVLLCADSESLQYPELIGLPDEELGSQPWLKLFSSGEAFRRRCAQESSSVEAWVISSDDIEPVNIAACLKRDDSARVVRLVTGEASGSLMTRAIHAGIDSVWTFSEFLASYARLKRTNSSLEVQVKRMPRHAPLEQGFIDEHGFDLPDETLSFDEQPTGKLLLPSSSGAMRKVLEALPHTTDDGATSMASPEGAQRPQEAGKRAFVIPIVSGSGGTGKSTIAVLCSVLAQQMGYRTLLLDCDLQFGDAASMLGHHDSTSIDVIADDCASAAGIAEQEQGKPAIVSSLKRPERAEEIIGQLPSIIDACAQHYDVIFVNTGTYWNEMQAALIERGDKTLFIVDQRPSSLRACKKALELCIRCGIATSPFLFVVNRCTKGGLYTSIDVSCALQGAPAFELRDGGFEVEELLTAGQPLDLVENQNELCVGIQHLLMSFLPHKEGVMALESAPIKKPWGLFGRGARAKVS